MKWKAFGAGAFGLGGVLTFVGAWLMNGEVPSADAVYALVGALVTAGGFLYSIIVKKEPPQ